MLYYVKWGAEVVAFGLSPGHSWDVVPFRDRDYRQHIKDMEKWYRKQNNGFWLYHKAFDLKAKMVYGIVYNLPGEIGMVDISTFFAVLLHFRDPFFALQNAAELTKKNLIITDVIPVHIIKDKFSQIIFRPALRLKQKATDVTWWYLPPETIVDFIGVLGFADVIITYHHQLWKNTDTNEYNKVPFYTFVGHRK